MVNTVTQRTLHGTGASRRVIRSIHIVSDGSEETDLVIYDNSAFVDDVLRGTVDAVMASGNSCTLRLEWDQTTDAPIVSLDPAYSQSMDFTFFGGISNPGAAGATGDILLTTAGLDAGDEVTLFLYIRQS